MTREDEHEPDAPELLSPGDDVDHFEVERLLGRGGMGEVYLARDRKLGRKVALKLLRRKAFGDSKALERFLHEARVTARFNHPNIVTAYSVGEHAGSPYVALEYIEGETLRDRLDRGPVPTKDAVGVGLSIAKALSEAHSHGVLHRDLKPENVLLSPDGRARVVDFGLAKAVDPPDIGLAATEAGSADTPLPDDGALRFDSRDRGIAGTPFYMAPEQWTGGPVTEATDVWALGVILYEMLVGERPFPGKTVFVLCGNVCASTPAPSLAARQGVPPLVASLVARCLAKEPAERPSGAEIVRRLQSLDDAGDEGRRRRSPLLAIGGAVVVATAVLLVAAAMFAGGAPTGGAARDEAGREGNDGRGVLFVPRMSSARGVLRIGLAELSELRGSELAPGVFWGLLHTEPDGREHPFLVYERPSLENGGARPVGGGGLEVTWRLREGLRWSDGRSLHAEDLVFALQVHDDPHVVSARAPDARTLVVHWDDAVSRAVESIRPLPRHVLVRIFSEQGGEGVLDFMRSHATPAVGPYRVEDFVANEGLLLGVNPHFIGPRAAIERIEVVVAPPAELVERFERGELDVIGPDAVSLDRARELQRRRPEAVHIRPSNRLFFMQPDLEVPVLDRVEVRRALLSAIDRAGLAEEVFGPEGRVAHAPVLLPPPGTVRYEHSPRTATTALAAAGIGETPIPLTHEGSATESAIAARVVEDLASVGLRAMDTSESARGVRRAFRAGRHGGLLLHSDRVFEGSSVLPHWNLPSHGDGFDTDRRHSGFDGWVAALVDRESRALYAERRAQLREALWVAYSERLPLLPLAFAVERVVVDPALRGWDQRPGDRFGRGLEQWYFVSAGDHSGGARQGQQ